MAPQPGISQVATSIKALRGLKRLERQGRNVDRGVAWIETWIETHAERDRDVATSAKGLRGLKRGLKQREAPIGNDLLGRRNLRRGVVWVETR